MSRTTKVIKVNINLLFIQAIMIVLKLLNVINITWLWVFCPLWSFGMLMAFTITIILTFMAVIGFCSLIFGRGR